MNHQNDTPICCCANCFYSNNEKRCILEKHLKGKCLPDGASPSLWQRDILFYKNGITFKKKYGYQYNYFEPKKEIIEKFSFLKKEDMEL